mmetsp:Transcript_159946/g.298395  ORF Transcript_159946/g.298395 Transcript_159946/m.298395 type:complete len:1013 (-) Transcript_159946:150-3188(-)
MTQSLASPVQDEVEDFSELPKPTFEDLLVQQAEVNRQLAKEHDRIVADLQREIEQLRASPSSVLNGPSKPAWTPPAPPPKPLRPAPLQTEQASPESPGMSPRGPNSMKQNWSEPATPMFSPRGTALSIPSARNSDVKAVSLADDCVEEIPVPPKARPKSAGAAPGSKAREGSIIKVEEGSGKVDSPAVEHKRRSTDNGADFSADVPATHQLLNPQGFKKNSLKMKDRKTDPALFNNEERRRKSDEAQIKDTKISFQGCLQSKHLSLPGRAGLNTSPDGSSSDESDEHHTIAKSLSWAPSEGAHSRKHSLASLNPLNWLLQKDEAEAPPSITVEETTEVVPSGSRRTSLFDPPQQSSRRPSLSANAVSGQRRPSFGGGSRRGSRRGSRVHTAPPGSIQAPPLAKAKFDPWPVWSAALDAGNQGDWERMSNISRHSVLVDAYRKLKSVDFHRHDGSDSFISWVLQKCVIHPSSLKRMLWVSLSGILITYDIITTPLRVFDLEETGFIRALNWVTMFFWTFDLIMSPFVGYHHQYNLEMRVKKTAFRYVSTWFAFDLLLVSSDWILVFFGEMMGDRGVEGARTLRTAKTFRMARALRSLRLLRVVKLPDMLKDATYLVGRSEYTSLTLGILKHVFGILLVNHLIACLWYVVGDAKDGWVPVYCKRCSVHMLYFTSLHWSLTQFTPATMAVQPQNFTERFFAVSVLLFALITFSSFVSSITNLMTHLRTLRSVESKQYMKLERYLHDRGISFHLSIRVRRYLEHVLSERARYLEESDIELLAKLSTPLHMELRYEVHFPILSRHPFFKHLAICNLQVMQRLCLEALKSLHVGAGDSLFCVGDSAHAMFFIERGILLYSKQAAFTISASPEMIESGNWCCEAVLWTPWEHRGEMRALTEANLLALQATKFHEIMSKNKTAAQQPAAYAAEVVDALNELERQELSDVDNVEQKREKLVMVKDAFEIDDESICDSSQPSNMLPSNAFTKMANKVVTNVTAAASRRSAESDEHGMRRQSS